MPRFLIILKTSACIIILLDYPQIIESLRPGVVMIKL